MARTFRCTIVTPADSVFDGDVSYVSMPNWDGQQGVMAGQSPILTRLGIGPLRIDADGATNWYLVDGGFAQVQNDHLTIITERAQHPGDVDGDAARIELAEANREAVKLGDRREAEASQSRARAKIAFASRG